MLPLKLSGKLIISYMVMAILLVICGATGYLAASKLSAVTDFLVKEARQTVTGALKTGNGVRDQIEVMDDILAGRLQGDTNQAVEQAQQVTDKAYQAMIDAGLIPEDQLKQMESAQQAFTGALKPLLATNTRYVDTYRQMIDNADQLNELFASLNDLANRIIVEKETNWDDDTAANSQQSEEWFAATAATEARLALFAQLYYYHSQIARLEDQKLQELITNSQSDLEIYVEDLTSMAITEQQPKGQSSSYAVLLKQKYDDHIRLYGEALKLYATLQQQREIYTRNATDLLQQTELIEQISDQIINREIKDINEIERSAYLSILATVIIGLVLVVVMSWIALRVVVSPLRNVADRLHGISQGEGDLTQTLELKGQDEITELSQGFNDFTQQIRSLISQLIDAIAQLSQRSTELAEQSSSTQQQMSEQQAVTNSVSEAMEDMSQKVDSVSQAATQAGDRMQNMDKTLEQSRTVISTTLNSINEFAGGVESASTVIEALNQDSQKIGSVLEVIQGIAEQTNLLALNAAIEAARAGEQGRGFAVVADEVRTLASRTQESTTEIREIIERLQQGAARAADSMKKSQGQAQETVSRTGSATESMATITREIEAMGEIISEINNASKSQDEQARTMRDNLQNIREITTRTGGSSQQMSEVTQKLNELASLLQSLVSRFKV